MAVIALPNVPPQGGGITDEWELRTISARFRSPLNGVMRTLERPGSAWAVTLHYNNLAGQNRALMQAFLASCRGFGQRFYVPHFLGARRGSFPASQLLTNHRFSNGATGWGDGSQYTGSVADGVWRATRDAVTITQPALVNSSAATLVQYGAYAGRMMLLQGRGSYGSRGVFFGSTTSGTEYGQSLASAYGLFTVGAVALATTGYLTAVDNASSGLVAGDYLQIPYTSLARCGLVDNGPNFTQYSDQIDNAYWSKTAATVNANAATAPDGTSTADTLVENSATSQHTATRSETRTATAADWCVFGYFKRASGTRNIRLVIGRDGSNFAQAYFDLGAGTLAAAASVSGDATNVRAVIAPAGDSWYYCAVVGRLTATTGLLVGAYLSSGTSDNYAGDSSSGVHCWRFGAAQSSAPTRGMQTTSAGDADGVPQTGGGLHINGLPASTSGLLEIGDPAEIVTSAGSQMIRATARLNSNSAGLGYLQFEPPLRSSPAHGAAVIIEDPLCLMMLDSNTTRWIEHDDGYSDLVFTAVEDVSA